MRIVLVIGIFLVIGLATIPEATADREVITIVMDGQHYELNYGIWNATVVASSVDVDSKTISFRINANDSGKFLVQLPSDLIRAQHSTQETLPFIVRIDDNEVPYDSIEDRPGWRIIAIPFSKGESEIEIMGTWMVPELPAVSLTALAMSLLVVIALFRSRHILSHCK